MPKLEFIILITLAGFSVITQCHAQTMDYDRKTQRRIPVPVTIDKVIDATTLLSAKGEVYNLVGLHIPDEETAIKAQEQLKKIAEKQKCILFQKKSDEPQVNRMGQIMGHFTCGTDNIWLQGSIISNGMAMVRSTPENLEQISTLLTLENVARTNKKGIWAQADKYIFNPDTASSHMNSFTLVEGKIFNVAQNRNSVFLNFSHDWKNDFTIGVPSSLRRNFSKERINLMSLKNTFVRVRGWMRNYNGPYIELDNIAQLEIITNTTTNDNNITETPPTLPTIIKEEKGENKFMHSIYNPTPPTIEEPELPPQPTQIPEDKIE